MCPSSGRGLFWRIRKLEGGKIRIEEKGRLNIFV